MAAALAVTGCSGDDGATGPQGPQGTSIGSTNTLPATFPTHPALSGVTVTSVIGDPGTGTWQIDIDDSVKLEFAGLVTVPTSLTYDSDENQWLINLDGTNFVLDELLSTAIFGDLGEGDCTDGVPECIELTVDALKYAILWTGSYNDADLEVADFFFTSGLATPAAGVPTTGTAVYGTAVTAAYSVELDGADAGDFSATTADLTVNFGTGAVTFTQPTITVGTAELTLAGTATVTGNSYTGSASGTFDPDNAGLTPPAGDGIIFDTGTLSGTFYGPSADETAGVLFAEDTLIAADGDGSILTGSVAGGFIADLTP